MKKTKVPGLAKNIKTMRENSKMTLEVAAKKVGLAGKTSFIAYESGRAEPNLATLLKMSDVFRYDVNDILRFEIKKLLTPHPKQ